MGVGGGAGLETGAVCTIGGAGGTCTGGGAATYTGVGVGTIGGGVDLGVGLDLGLGLGVGVGLGLGVDVAITAGKRSCGLGVACLTIDVEATCANVMAGLPTVRIPYAPRHTVLNPTARTHVTFPGFFCTNEDLFLADALGCRTLVVFTLPS